MALPIKPPFPPMESRSVDEIPVGDNWQYEPKWDGFRCLAFRDGENFSCNRNPANRSRVIFRTSSPRVAKLKTQKFVLDGELVIPIGGALSFDELQLRLHPAASRVQKLAAAHPALFVVFDLLVGRKRKKSRAASRLRSAQARVGKICARKFQNERRHSPLAGHDGSEGREEMVRQSRRQSRWHDRETARLALRIRRTQRDGEGQTDPHGRLCCRRISLCERARIIGSLLLGLYDDDGLLHHVGFTSAFKARRSSRPNEEIRSVAQTAGLYRQCAGRAKPLEHGTQRRMGTGRSENCRGSDLRPFHRRSFPARNKNRALAS